MIDTKATQSAISWAGDIGYPNQPFGKANRVTSASFRRCCLHVATRAQLRVDTGACQWHSDRIERRYANPLFFRSELPGGRLSDGRLLCAHVSDGDAVSADREGFRQADFSVALWNFNFFIIFIFGLGTQGPCGTGFPRQGPGDGLAGRIACVKRMQCTAWLSAVAVRWLFRGDARGCWFSGPSPAQTSFRQH